jgi:RNA polymerase sigma-70 factor (ECF subfamily)
VTRSILDGDRELLDAFRRGDRDALARIYHHHVDEVGLVIRRGFTIEAHGHVHVPGAGDVDAEHELIQEVFVRAFSPSARAAFDGLRPYRPYLLRIAKNLLIDRARAQRRREVPLDDIDLSEEAAAAELPANDGAAPEDDLDWKRLLAVAETYVAGLDRESQEFIRLRFEEELSQDETATRLGVSRRRVRTLETRTQSGLRKQLARNGLSRGRS